MLASGMGEKIRRVVDGLILLLGLRCNCGVKTRILTSLVTRFLVDLVGG